MSWMQSPRANTNKVVTVPAPVGGLNARDSLIAMAQEDAIAMNNWWPQPYGLSLRKGYREWATGLPSSVDTLATLATELGTQLMYAWSGTAVYNVTTRGPVGAPVLSGLGGANAARWQTLGMTNEAGSQLIAVNGFDDAIVFSSNGSATRIQAGDGTGTTWAGLSPKQAVQLTSHQGRLWATQVNSQKGWYLPVGAIYGTMVSFDFGPMFKRGGYLAFLSTWTIDDGNGAEDHLVAVSSMGEAVVYGGTDPSSDTAWSQVGVYFVGAPLPGRRSYSKVGADLAILSQRGVVSMATLLASTKINESEQAIKTDKIQYLVSSVTTTYVNQFGWQLAYYAGINMLLFNIPNNTDLQNRQLVSNQVSSIQPWSTFSGMNAVCWGQFNMSPMFGSKDGRVFEAWTGYADNVDLDDLNGTDIVAVAQQAYSPFGSPSVQKQIDMYRPNFVVVEPIAVSTSIIYDFTRPDSIIPNALASTNPNLATAVWGTAIWGQDLWGEAPVDPGTPPATSSQRTWIQGQGIGVSASLQLTVQAASEVLWVSTDYSLKSGTLL